MASRQQPEDPRVIRERTTAAVTLAVAEGRHSPGPALRVCGSCGEWVSSLYYRTLSGAYICPGCADKIGRGPAADAARRPQVTVDPDAEVL